MTQLSLELERPAPNPNADWFNEAGTPKRLLWCSDTIRIGWTKGVDVPCPYLGDRARFRPAGGCCKDLAAPPRAAR